MNHQDLDACADNTSVLRLVLVRLPAVLMALLLATVPLLG